MEPLKKQLDFKLVFDVLCEPNGMVLVDKLLETWPSSETGAGRLEQSCMKHWTRAANDAGYLSWESFCAGVRGAILAEADSDQIGPNKSRDLDASQLSKGFHVPTERMEATLNKCEGPKLLEALTRSRKEVYNQQQALQIFTSPPGSEYYLFAIINFARPITHFLFPR